MKKKVFTSLGLMTGTSIDGVDLSIIKSDGINEFEPILDDYFEFDKKIQKKIEKLRDELSNLDDLKRNKKNLDELEREFTLFIGEIVGKFINKIDQEIDLIGFHGQTIFHDSKKKDFNSIGQWKVIIKSYQKDCYK